MDFKQTEKKFEKLKAQFTAGTLSEAEFKTQLEELMLQDEQGSWWMIGYETEKWYRYNGSDWVQIDPPGISTRKSTHPPLKQEIGTNIPRRDLDNQRSFWKFGKKEVIQSAIGLGVFTVLFFLLGRSFRGLSSYWSLAFAVPLFFGVVFGPIVGAIVGAGGYIIANVFILFQYLDDSGGSFLFNFSVAALFAVALEGFIMGFANTPSNNFRSFKSILRVELFIVSANLVRLLLSLNLASLFHNFYSATYGIWSSLALSLILVPIGLIVYSFILSRIKPRT